MNQLKLPNLQYTPTLLQLADRYVIKLGGVLEDTCVSLDSLEYPIDFMILTPKSDFEGHAMTSMWGNVEPHSCFLFDTFFTYFTLF